MATPISYGRRYKFHRPGIGISIEAGHNQQEVLSVSGSLAGSTERMMIDVTPTITATFLTGTSLIYSGGRGSSGIKINTTLSSASGGWHNLYSNVSTSGEFTTDGHGVVGVKSVVTNTAALTDGEVYAGQFIAKHNHATNVMTASASLVGIEAWGYVSAAGPARTVLGGNFGWHNEATGGTFGSGSVIRGVQIFCDNNAGGNDPDESSGLCLWNQAGNITNAIAVVNSGSGFTNFINAFSAAGCFATSGSDYTLANPRAKITIKIGADTYYLIGYGSAS